MASSRANQVAPVRIIIEESSSKVNQRNVIVKWNKNSEGAKLHMLIITDEKKEEEEEDKAEDDEQEEEKKQIEEEAKILYLIWHVNNQPKQTMQLCGRKRFTIYGLDGSRETGFKIISSKKAVMNIPCKGSRVRQPLFLEPHVRTNSILGRYKSEEKLFPLAMDPTQSYLQFETSLPKTCQGLLLYQQEQPFEEKIFLMGKNTLDMTKTDLKTTFPSRTDIKLQVLVMGGKEVRSSSEIHEIRTYLSETDLEKLYTMAVQYSTTYGGRRRVLLPNFFRNKSWEDFITILKKKNGLMEVRKKDANGDQDSSINNNIDGIFFSATLQHDNHQPHEISPFGPGRIHIPANTLFTDKSKLYFADFYCITDRNHNITLVLTEEGTEADDFCRQCLIELDPNKNHFLTRNSETNEVYTRPARQFYIEVFYTKDINIFKYSHEWTTHETFGYGMSKPNGMPKRPDCTICNLPEI